jgi:uncharacterized phage-associated protein
MAEVIPSGVIQLPNFAELQYKLNRQKQSDDMAVARDLAQYKRQAGQIAPGAMPLVQREFDAWQNAAKKYAADQSAASFAELNNAYDNYSQAHGYAKFLFDTVKERDAMYYKEPTKWNIKVDDYVADSGNILNNQYSSIDELVAASSNISSLSPAKKYDFGSAEEWSKGTLDSWKNVYKDLDTKGTGRISPEQRDDWFKNVFNHQIAKDDASRMNAVLSEARVRGLFGDGPITNDDINRVIADAELSTELLDSFYSRAKSNFDPSAGLTVVGQYQVNEDQARAARERAKASEDAGIPKDYRNLRPIDPPPSIGPGVVYRIDNAPVRTSDGTKIVGFGLVNGKELVQVIGEDDPFAIVPQGPQWRVATSSDKANLEKETGGAYNSYVRQGVSLPESSGQPQRTQSNNPLGLDL